MSDITVLRVNNLKSKIVADPSTILEISDEFSFFPEGYKHMPAYKSGRWDGKIRMIDLRSKQMYTGLIPDLVPWAEENGYSIRFDDILPDGDWFDEAELHAIAAASKYPEPRWYQSESVRIALTEMKSCILLPTAAGKSYVTYLVVRHIVDNLGKKVLINVPSTMLAEQLKKDFADYATDGWSVEDHVHTLHSGKDRNTGKPVIISTWQTCKEIKTQAWFQQFDAYICDEAHEAKAKCLTAIIDNMAHANFRLALTGTLDGTLLHTLELKGRFGPIHKPATSKDLQDQGFMSQLDIDCIQLRYSDDEVDLAKHFDYEQEIDFLLKHERRNKFLARLGATRPGNVLMIFNYIERHGHKLRDLLEPLCEQHGKKLYYIDGSVGVEDRETFRQEIINADNALLLANSKLISVGVNIPNLNTLIICHPLKARIRTLQSIGRILRLSDGKAKARFIDIADDLSYTTRTKKKKLNVTLRHFLERLKIYVSEKFNYRIIPLNL